MLCCRFTLPKLNSAERNDNPPSMLLLLLSARGARLVGGADSNRYCIRSCCRQDRTAAQRKRRTAPTNQSRSTMASPKNPPPCQHMPSKASAATPHPVATMPTHAIQIHPRASAATPHPVERHRPACILGRGTASPCARLRRVHLFRPLVQHETAESLSARPTEPCVWAIQPFVPHAVEPMTAIRWGLCYVSPSKPSSLVRFLPDFQYGCTCSSLPLVFGCSDVAC